MFNISSTYIGITRSLGTRRTLWIPKLLKCINKAQPEPCYKKTQLQSRSHAYENRELWGRSPFIFTRAPQPWLQVSTSFIMLMYYISSYTTHKHSVTFRGYATFQSGRFSLSCFDLGHFYLGHFDLGHFDLGQFGHSKF